jgi:hypothetical protein
MASIKINVTPDALSAEEIKEESETHPQISLIARKTVDGKIMVLDHKDLDIVIDHANKKIITFPKNEMSDEIYQIQNNYFNFLSQKGVVERSSVHAGDVYASIQGSYPEAIDEGVDATQVVLLSTYQFIEQERPKFEAEERYEEEIDDWYTEPDAEDSTVLGEVPESPDKGSINPNNPWTYYSGYYS